MGDKVSINVSQFLRQYESAGTRRVYLTGLKFFFKSIYPESKGEDLDILSKRYLVEDRDHREDILKFKESLEDKAPGTKNLRLNTVRAFLSDNEIIFPKRFFKNLNGRTTEPITWEKIPSNEELKRVIEYLPVQGKAFALVLSSSGMRIGEVVKIKVNDIDLNSNPVKIRIRGEYTKTGKRRITFISPEAKEAVEEWLTYREQYLERAQNRTQREFRKDKGDNLFPFTADNFNQMWHNALGKAQLLERDEKTNRVTMRPHNLRKFFRLRVGRYGRDEAEALMGHQAGLNRIYANFDGAEERLEEVYKKSIEELSIYKRTVQVVQLDEEMKNTIRTLEDQINALVNSGLEKDAKITYLTVKIGDLMVNDEKKTKEIDQLKHKTTNMERDIHNWKMIADDVDKILTYTRSKMKEEASNREK